MPSAAEIIQTRYACPFHISLLGHSQARSIRIEGSHRCSQSAADRADIIIKGLNKAIDTIPTMSIGARVNPDSLKVISDACNKFALDVANQLTVHRNKRLEQQKAHEQRIARPQLERQRFHEQRIARTLRDSQGIWLSYHWLKLLSIFLITYSILIILFVKFG